MVVPRRFKKYVPPPKVGMADELDWELTILLWLEQQIFRILEVLSVDTGLWNYYMGYAKRLWERAVKFSQQTFKLEKTSLIVEYILRGLNEAILRHLQTKVEQAASYKRTGIYPYLGSAWSYASIAVWHVDLGGYFNLPHGGVGFYIDAPPSQQGAWFNRS